MRRGGDGRKSIDRPRGGKDSIQRGQVTASPGLCEHKGFLKPCVDRGRLALMS